MDDDPNEGDVIPLGDGTEGTYTGVRDDDGDIPVLFVRRIID